MKTTLLVVGRTVEQHYITAINDYIQRTKRYITFDMEVIPELKNTKSLSMDLQKEKEGELILKALQPGDVIVLLDEHGKEMRSLEFAEYMKRKMNTVNKRLVFIIGGPYGFSEKVYQVANEKISMSKMTFLYTSDESSISIEASSFKDKSVSSSTSIPFPSAEAL